MKIANIQCNSHYLGLKRQYQYSREVENKFVFYLKKIFKQQNATLIISDMSPIFGFAMLEAAQQLNIPSVAYLPHFKFGVTFDKTLRKRIDVLSEYTKITFTSEREYGDWLYPINTERMICDCDLVLNLNKYQNYYNNRIKHYNKIELNIWGDVSKLLINYKNDFTNYSLQI